MKRSAAWLCTFAVWGCASPCLNQEGSCLLLTVRSPAPLTSLDLRVITTDGLPAQLRYHLEDAADAGQPVRILPPPDLPASQIQALLVRGHQAPATTWEALLPLGWADGAHIEREVNLEAAALPDPHFKAQESSLPSVQVAALASGRFRGGTRRELALLDATGERLAIADLGGDGQLRITDGLWLSKERSPATALSTQETTTGADVVLVLSQAQGLVLRVQRQGTGTLGVLTPVPYADPNQAPAAVASGDFDKDGQGDLLIANPIPGAVIQLNTRLSRQALNIPGARLLRIGDANGDGWPDALLLNGGAEAQWLMNDKGQLRYGQPAGRCQQPVDAALDDWDQDGSVDVLLACPRDQSLQIFLTRGVPSAPLRLPLRDGPQALARGDFNKDGKADAGVLLQSGRILVLLGDGRGALRPTLLLPGLTGSTHLLSSDLDGDGWPDLITAAGSRLLIHGATAPEAP